MANGTDPAGQSQPRVVTPEEIQHQEFGVSRFGGYRMRDVDEFLDTLTASTQSLLAENERLRGGGGPILGTPDLEEVNRQADEILQRARTEAARIVADASAQAGASPVAPADRGAVDAFLAQERDFLQNLATLVQAHAETVKAMARRTRQAAVEPPPSPAERDAEAVVDVSDAADEPTKVDLPPAAPAPDAEEHPGPEASEATPQRREAPARPEGEAGEGDPSLRALFWGDD
jgi:DivIVA domain-containing protein